MTAFGHTLDMINRLKANDGVRRKRGLYFVNVKAYDHSKINESLYEEYESINSFSNPSTLQASKKEYAIFVVVLLLSTILGLIILS